MELARGTARQVQVCIDRLGSAMTTATNYVMTWGELFTLCPRGQMRGSFRLMARCCLSRSAAP